jgi:hypothetical protein
MPIGTSDGETYDNEWEYASAQTSNRMPLEDTEKPTGELNSQEGSPVSSLTHLANKLSETWPAKAIQGFVDAASLPHDVYNGQVDPKSDEGIKRAANFALVFGTGGMDSAGKEATLDVAKNTARDTLTSPLDLDRLGNFAAAVRSGTGL